ncbi:MAG TPA: hypothetical protein VFC63_05530 [Blastocatellia bacterium]|nr:hypothetical protein [Blastocatellia bacterium]
MISVVGVFSSRADAECAAIRLRDSGVSTDNINLLIPDAPNKGLKNVPVADMEERGVGEALGGVIGGAVGAAGGLSLGMAAASLFIPGVGPILAVGIAAAAILGAGGAVSGALVGGAIEETGNPGLPHDELYVYEDALRHSRTVLIAFVEHDAQVRLVREILTKAGAETLDAAKENWWLGLRDVEEEDYTRQGHDFKTCESSYRCGFEAAQHPFARDKSYEQVQDHLKRLYPDTYQDPAFRDGFNRGKVNRDRTMEEHLQPQ